MDELFKMEENAAELYEQGKFTEVREIFKLMSRTTNSKSLEDLYRFNIASCYASQEDYVTALNQLMEIGSFAYNDTEMLYNKAMCLSKLSRPDVALSILDTVARDKTKQDGNFNEDLIVQLLIDCMENLGHHDLNRSQCELLERLLLEYRSQLVVSHGENLWTKNMGHVLFLADTRFEDCLKLYETLLGDDDNGDADPNPNDLLKVDPSVLGNLCVSYILTGRNRDAEELIKEAEYAEETQNHSEMLDKSSSLIQQMSNGTTQRTSSTLTELNLAIGTLYCVKGNHEFGLTRVFKSLEPIDRKLTAQSWRQAKKCILATLDKHCKQMIYIKDELFDQMVAFLIQCETCGVHVAINDSQTIDTLNDGKNSVTYEARYLRSIILRLVND